MILATIEFPNGSRINFGEDGRWTGNDEAAVAYANDFQPKPGYRYDFAASLAAEIAAKIGGKVVFAVDLDSQLGAARRSLLDANASADESKELYPLGWKKAQRRFRG